MIVERRHAPASALSRYALTADSFATSFLECMDGPHLHPLLVRLRESAEAAALLPYREQRPPLSYVGAFLARLEFEIENEIARHPGCRFVREREVRSIHLMRDHVAVDCANKTSDTLERFSGRTAIVAFGGTHIDAQAARTEIESIGALGHVAGDRLRSSDRLLTEAGILRAIGDLEAVKKAEVVVVGGSHNAFSAAVLLTQRAPEGMFADGSIAIAARRPPRIFYRSRNDAVADEYRSFNEADICPRTGRIHQLGGLRGDGRELWRRITKRPGAPREARVTLLDLGSDAEEARARIARSTLIVAATGYEARMPRMFGSERELVLRAHAAPGSATVDDRGRVLTADGAPIDRVFSLGMGSGFVPSGSMGGEPSFKGHTNGVWLYQHFIGQRIHDEIQNVLATDRT